MFVAEFEKTAISINWIERRLAGAGRSRKIPQRVKKMGDKRQNAFWDKHDDLAHSGMTNRDQKILDRGPYYVADTDKNFRSLSKRGRKSYRDLIRLVSTTFPKRNM